ncbi:MAG: hypothetical protein GX568_06105 [Candidatus Gastranaerophilales bacterium]|nr:hypothetical protein [Candidatus Gastranaerophilales bacterium]
MKKLILNTFLALMLVVCCNLAAGAVEFSADMFTNGQPAGKIFVKGTKSRINTPGNQQYIINRLDKNVTYIVMPAEKMYLEQKFDTKAIPSGNIDPAKPGYKKEFIKAEAVNGKPAKKYKVTVDNNVSYQWYVDGILIPVKIQDPATGSVIEYKNISTTVQDSMFELPQGYQRMQMPAIPKMPGMQQMPNMNQMKNFRNPYN